MNNEKISSQKVANGSKNPIISVILGIVSIGLFWIPSGLAWNYFIYTVMVALICAVFGIRLGIKGLKSSQKRLSIVGIAVCSLGLLWTIYLLIGWILVGGHTEL